MDAGVIETLPSDVARSLESELRRGWELERTQAEARRGQIAEWNKMEHKAIDGLGEQIGRIEATSFHYWGQREGYDCWSDKGFLKSYFRDVPDAKVKSSGTKIQVGHR